MLTVADRVVKEWAKLMDEEIGRLAMIVTDGSGIPDIEAYRRNTGAIAGLRQALDLWAVAEENIKGK